MAGFQVYIYTVGGYKEEMHFLYTQTSKFSYLHSICTAYLDAKYISV